MSRSPTDAPGHKVASVAARFWQTPDPLWIGLDGVRELNSGQDHPDLRAWCRAHPGRAALVMVSSQLLHEVTCPPGTPLRSSQEIGQFARQFLTHYHGLAAQAWDLATWQAGARWRPLHRGASALHTGTLAALQQATDGTGCRLHAVRPWWSVLLQGALHQQPALRSAEQACLVIAEGALLNLVIVRHGQCVEVRRRMLQDADARMLPAVLAEEGLAASGPVFLAGWGLQHAADPTAGLQVLGDPTARRPRAEPWMALPRLRPLRPGPDLLRPLGTVSPQAWLAAAAGLTACVWAVAMAGQAGLERAALQATLQEREAAMAQASGADRNETSARTAPDTPSSSGADRTQLGRGVDGLSGNQALYRLNHHDWPAVMASLEGAPGKVHWLQFEHNAPTGEVRLAGAADHLDAAALVADHLASQPGWAAVKLQRVASADSGQQGVRFELSAAYRPAEARP